MDYKVLIEGRSMCPATAMAYVGGRELLENYLNAGWLTPYVKRHRLVRYDRRDLDRCIDRHKIEQPIDEPGPTPRAYGHNLG